MHIRINQNKSELKYQFKLFINLLLFLLIAQFSHAQNKGLAYDFDPYHETLKSVENDDDLDDDKAFVFHASYQYFKKDLLNKNMVVTTPSLVNYFTDILKTIEPVDWQKYNLVLINSTVPNAMALPDGTVFLNLGLALNMKNDDELAFILSHELAHVFNKHGKKAYTDQLNMDNTVKGQKEGKAFLQLKYSRTAETEADMYGVRKMINSKYNARSAAQALENLADSLFCEFDNYSAFKILGMDSVDFKNISKNNSDYTLNKNEIEKDYHDVFYTHPAIDSRVLAVNEFLKLSEYANSGLPKPNETAFNAIKKECLKQLISACFDRSEYGLSLYLTLKGLSLEPNNSFYQSAFLKNMYWCIVYKQKGKLSQVLNEPYYINTIHYKAFVKYLENIDVAKLKTINYDQAKLWIKKSTSDDLHFYYAMSSEHALGNEVSKLLFEKYMINYPKGKYYDAAKAKK